MLYTDRIESNWHGFGSDGKNRILVGYIEYLCVSFMRLNPIWSEIYPSPFVTDAEIGWIDLIRIQDIAHVGIFFFKFISFLIISSNQCSPHAVPSCIACHDHAKIIGCSTKCGDSAGTKKSKKFLSNKKL